MLEPANRTPTTPDTVRTVFARLRERKPDLREITDAFEETSVTQARLAEELPLVDLGEWSPPASERRCEGVSLLADDLPAGLPATLITVADTLLPVLGRSFGTIEGELRAFGLALAEGRLDGAALIRAVLDRNRLGLAGLAEAAGLSPGVVAFAAPMVLAPALARLASDLAPLLCGASWGKGTCPVCGGLPAVSYLGKRDEDGNEFLVGGGGRKFLVCSQCASQWHLPRVTCPVCECTESGKLGYFRVEGCDHERIDYCEACKSYLPGIDLRAALDPAPAAIAGIELVHLDLLAQERGYRPAAELPWNRLD